MNIMNIFLFNRKCLLGTSWNDHFELHDPVGPCPALSGPVGSVPFGPLGPPLWRPLAELNFCRSNVGSAWRDKTTATGSSCKGTWRRGDTRLTKETDGRPMGDPWETHGIFVEHISIAEMIWKSQEHNPVKNDKILNMYNDWGATKNE